MADQLNLYYFSGTGNARNVAGWISEVAVQRGMQSNLINIAETDRKHIQQPPENSMVGFVSPTHGFNYPPVTMYFIFRFPRSRGNRVFIMNTRAGLKLSKWFVPGLSGLALWLAALVLLVKGYRIVGMRSIDLPSNWISFHPGVKAKVVESIYAHCKKITTTFAGNIFDGKRVYTAFRDIIQDILVSPIAIGYFFMGRFLLAKSFYATETCDNCGLCWKNCPVQAISLVDNRPFWSYRCESCMKCMNNCPKRSIETAHGFIIGIMFLINMVILAWFWRWVGHFITIPEDNGWITLIITPVRWFLTFLSIVALYRIYHYLLRIPGVKQLMYYTSLTRYRFWRRYKPSRKMISQLP